MLVVEHDNDQVDAGRIVRDVTAKHGRVPMFDGRRMEGRRVFQNDHFTLIHQGYPDHEIAEVYYRGDFVYREIQILGMPPIVEAYHPGIWEQHIRSEFHLAPPTKPED